MTQKICPKENNRCNWEFRSFRVSDLPYAREFLKRTFPHMEHYFPKFETELLTSDAYVLHDHKKILGILDIGAYSVDPTKKWINLLGVDPSIQKQGVGKKLLNAAEKIAIEKFNEHELHLLTEGYRKGNVRFYQNSGWKIANIRSGLYPHTLAVHFSKIF